MLDFLNKSSPTYLAAKPSWEGKTMALLCELRIPVQPLPDVAEGEALLSRNELAFYPWFGLFLIAASKIFLYDK